MKTSQIVAVVLGVVVLLAACLGLSALGYPGDVTTAENGITAQYKVCVQGISTSYQIIQGQAQVDARFDTSMRELFEAIFTAQTEDAQQSANQQLLALISANTTLSATDFTATKLELQRTIAAELTKFANCMASVADRQAVLRNLLGTTANALPGQAGSFPNSQLAAFFKLPHKMNPNAADAPASDLDGDGHITALDYPSMVVTALIKDSVDDGTLPDLDIYTTPAP